MNNHGQNRSSILSPPRTFLFLATVYFGLMLLMTLLRGLFVYDLYEYFAGADTSEIAQAFFIGMRFDQVIAAYLLLPLLLVLPWAKTSSSTTRLVTTAYLTLSVSFITILSLIDIRFADYFESRLNFLALEYFLDSSYAMNMIGADSSVSIFVPLWLAITAVVLWATYFLYTRICFTTMQRQLSHRLVWSLLFVLLAVGGIRGRVGLAPIDWGLAYFSSNRMVNQLALNGVYTLARNLTETTKDPRLVNWDPSRRFEFVNFDSGRDSVIGWLNQDGDEWLDDHTVIRKRSQPELTNGFQPNIVIVLMESWSGRNTGVLGSTRNLTPHFDRLSQDGLLFTNFYASGIRTNFGLAASLCSFPSLPGRALLKRYDAIYPDLSLAQILSRRGYYNAFYYGGDLEFDNVRGFFTEHSYDLFQGQDDFASADYFSKWGVPDHILFDRVTDMIDTLPRPFQATLLTLSNHEPFDLPDSTVRKYFNDDDSSIVFNAQLYADFALGRFIDSVSNRSWHDSTIFVFTADHGLLRRSAITLGPGNFRVPLLIYAPWLLADSGIISEVVGSQVDILPTLMGLLGGDYQHASWGRDLLNLPDSAVGFASMNHLDRIGMANDSFIYIETVGRPGELFSIPVPQDTAIDVANIYPEIFRQLQRMTRIYMQIADQMSTPEADIAK